MAQVTTSFTIGELSRRTSVPVKTLRFWSDEGLLPPAARTTSGYRVYDERSVARLELVLALREAGLGIDRIRAVLARDLSLEAALRLRLAAVEAHIGSLEHVASALRAALRSEPTEHDLRRITAVTRLSRTERQDLVERFYAQVTEGAPVDAGFTKSMIEASQVELPHDPTPEQVDAWVELGELLSDATFVAYLKQGVQQTWTPGFDLAAYRRASDAMLAEAKAAIAEGTTPEDARARPVVERFVAGAATAMGAEPDEAFRQSLRARFVEQDSRGARYWKLVGIVKGRAPSEDEWPTEGWDWFVAASRHHFP